MRGYVLVYPGERPEELDPEPLRERPVVEEAVLDPVFRGLFYQKRNGGDETYIKKDQIRTHIDQPIEHDGYKKRTYIQLMRPAVFF